MNDSPTTLPLPEELKARARELAIKCVPAVVIFADNEEHVADLRRRAADHIEAALSQPSPPLPLGLREALERIVGARVAYNADPVGVIETMREWARQALSATAQDAWQDGKRWRHVKRGTEYVEIGRAELQDANGVGVWEGQVLAIYRGDDGKLWAREEAEFEDGRFVPTPSTQGEG